MYRSFSFVLCLLLPAIICSPPPSPAPPQYIFSNPPPHAQDDYRIPTSRESAILGRRILALTPLGTLSTVFPTSHGAAADDDASGYTSPAPGFPIGLMDYISDCSRPSIGDPTLLAITIATSFRNAAAGSGISLALRWTPPYPPAKRISLLSSLRSLARIFTAADASIPPHSYDYSAANLPRFSLLGHLESIPEAEVESGHIGECFTAAHPDAHYWLPGNRIHRSKWMKLVVEKIYWVGGFGDRAYIGWIPVDEWRNVTEKEWQNVRLPGEKDGWREWSTAAWDL